MESSNYIAGLRQLLIQNPSESLWSTLLQQVSQCPTPDTRAWLTPWLKEHLQSWPTSLRKLNQDILERLPTPNLSSLKPVFPLLHKLSVQGTSAWIPLLQQDLWESLRELEWYEAPEFSPSILHNSPFLAQLETLSWTRNQMQAQQLSELLALFPKFRQLHSLDLQYNQLEDLGAERIAQHGSSPALRHLSLQYNELSHDFYDFVVEAEFETLRWDEVLIHLEEMMYAGMGRSGPLQKTIGFLPSPEPGTTL